MINKIRDYLKRRKGFISLREFNINYALQNMAYRTKTNKINMCLGSILVVYGVVTLPIPTCSIPAIVGGIGLFFNPISIKVLVTGLYYDIKFKLGLLLW